MKGLLCTLLLFVVEQQVTGGLGENGISQQNPPQTDTSRAEASSDSQQQCQPCLPDIHAALRELTATVREQRADIRALETRLSDAERAAEQQTFILEELNRKNDDREIAFSASLMPSKRGDIGPFTTEITLTYRNVFTNIGNAYNPITGIFTAPLKGAYMFKFSVYALGSQTNPASAFIMKNEVRVVMAHAQQNQGAFNSFKGVVLLLEVGDVVYVRLLPNSRIHDNMNNHNTFSGYILFPLR